MGKSILFEETSIQQFEKTFDRDDYITYRECSKQLDELGFTSFRDNRVNIYFNPLNIYLNTKTLINGSDDIPSEYQLITKEFGDTQFISKKSFSKTLRWLKSEYQRLYPKHTSDEFMKRDTKPLSFPKRKPKFKKSV